MNGQRQLLPTISFLRIPDAGCFAVKMSSANGKRMELSGILVQSKREVTILLAFAIIVTAH